MVLDAFPMARWPDRAAARLGPIAVSALIAGAALFAAMPADAAEYSLDPGQKVVGHATRYTVKDGEVFADIARQFDIGYTELVTANPGVNPWVPGAGRTITIPTVHVLPDAPREGVVINLAQWRLFYFPPGGDRVETHPITIGFMGKDTPIGVTRIVSKETNPTWYPPASIRREEPDLPAAVPPGPDDPLGLYAMHLGWKSYLIHGTNKPDSIGRAVSHGCMRLYPEDVEKLFGEVNVGTSVRTVQEPATAGWKGDALYVQVYPSKSQTEEIDTMQPITPDPASGVETIVRAAAGNYAQLVDWGAVQRAAQYRTGTAVKVAERSGAIASAEPDDSAAAPPPRETAYDAGRGAAYDPYSAYQPPRYGSSRAAAYDPYPAYEPPRYGSSRAAAYDPYAPASAGGLSGWGGIPRSGEGSAADYRYGQPVPPPSDAQKLYSNWGLGSSPGR